MKIYIGENLNVILEEAAQELSIDRELLQYSILHQDENEVQAYVYTTDDIKEFLFNYLGDFFTEIDLDIEVSIEELFNSYHVNLNAENNAILIGKQGRTLQAFNILIKSVVNAVFKRHIDVVIDINHYKEDRYAKIKSLAKRIARQVQESHVDVALDPMPNDERKVIHKALSDWEGISTESEGVGAQRHICIRFHKEDIEEIPNMSL